MEIPASLAAVLRRIEQIESASSGASPAAFETSVSEAGKLLPAPARFDRLIGVSAARFGIDKALVKAIVANESAFDPAAISPAGARGLMQLEPGTAAELGVDDPFDAQQNLLGGSRYLRGLLDRFGGNLRLALAAYNAGPQAVAKYGGVPPYAETRAYVENVLATYHRYKKQP